MAALVIALVRAVMQCFARSRRAAARRAAERCAAERLAAECQYLAQPVQLFLVSQLHEPTPASAQHFLAALLARSARGASAPARAFLTEQLRYACEMWGQAHRSGEMRQIAAAGPQSSAELLTVRAVDVLRRAARGELITLA